MDERIVEHQYEQCGIDIQKMQITIMKYVQCGNTNLLDSRARLHCWHVESMLKDIEKKRVPGYIKQSIKEYLK